MKKRKKGKADGAGSKSTPGTHRRPRDGVLKRNIGLIGDNPDGFQFWRSCSHCSTEYRFDPKKYAGPDASWCFCSDPCKKVHTGPARIEAFDKKDAEKIADSLRLTDEIPGPLLKPFVLDIKRVVMGWFYMHCCGN